MTRNQTDKLSTFHVKHFIQKNIDRFLSLFFLHDSCDASFDDATSLSAVGIMLFIG
jgi:hypothetical protein